MSTTPTDRLKTEHENILNLLGILDSICLGLETKRAIDPLHLGRVIKLMKVFIDKIHHGKEEDLLFPLMRKAGGRSESVQASELMMDHIKGRSLFRDMDLAALRYSKYDRDAPARFVERAKSYISLLTEHIRRENEVYFPIVEKVLSGKQKKGLLDSFEGLDKTIARHNERPSRLQTLQKFEDLIPD